MRMIEGRSHLSVKLNAAGVIPAIVAILAACAVARDLEFDQWAGSRVGARHHRSARAGTTAPYDRLRACDRAFRAPLRGVRAEPRAHRRGSRQARRRHSRGRARRGHGRARRYGDFAHRHARRRLSGAGVPDPGNADRLRAAAVLSWRHRAAGRSLHDARSRWRSSKTARTSGWEANVHEADTARSPGGGEGHAGAAAGRGARHRAAFDRGHVARGGQRRHAHRAARQGHHGARRAGARRRGGGDRRRPHRRARCAQRLHPRRLSAHGAAGACARPHAQGEGPRVSMP